MQRHEADVHLQNTAVKCPQCGKTLNRYYTGYILFNILSRESSLPDHFERVHTGNFRANAKLSICSHCGKLDSCSCKANQKELSPREMERRVREKVRDLGFDRETRRYCWTWFKIIMLREFFLMHSFSV